MVVVMVAVVMEAEAMDFMAVDSTVAACAPVTFTAAVAGIEAGAAVASIMATVFTITAASTAAATTRATIITAAAE